MAQEQWKVNPGRRPGPAVEIGEFLTRAYQADDWVRDTYRYEPPGQRVTKGRFCERLHISRPTVNKYLAGCGVPFPLPPRNHLVWATNATPDHAIRWVNPKLCDALQRDEEYFLGRDAHDALRGVTQKTDPGHAEELEQLRRGEIDVHECSTVFERADGLLVPLRLWVYYGQYDVWLGVAEVAGEVYAAEAEAA